MIVYGKNVFKELSRNPKKIQKVILQDHFDDKSIISLIQKLKLPVEYASKKELDLLVDGLHQGIIMYIEDYHYCSLENVVRDYDGVLVILDHLEDPHNLGAIIRTCEAAGVDGIILPKNRSVEVNSTVMKTSAGALANVKIARVVNLADAIRFLKKNGYWIVGTAMESSCDYREIDYRGKIALVIGNEGTGVHRLILDQCDFIAHIPMRGQVNSLNASVSAGIMIYEIMRCRMK